MFTHFFLSQSLLLDKYENFVKIRSRRGGLFLKLLKEVNRKGGGGGLSVNKISQAAADGVVAYAQVGATQETYWKLDLVDTESPVRRPLCFIFHTLLLRSVWYCTSSMNPRPLRSRGRSLEVSSIAWSFISVRLDWLYWLFPCPQDTYSRMESWARGSRQALDKHHNSRYHAIQILIHTCR